MPGCPCGTSKDFTECCGPYLSGIRKPATAEALMRSRYTAYTRHQISYITQTHDPRTRQHHDAEKAREWAQNSEWLGFEILKVEGGTEGDVEGMVEFIARYKTDGEETEHHEVSQFTRRGDDWYFTDGKIIGPEPLRREETKVGRNDPCPCGSGKKYKKCCGKG